MTPVWELSPWGGGGLLAITPMAFLNAEELGEELCISLEEKSSFSGFGMDLILHVGWLWASSKCWSPVEDGGGMLRQASASSCLHLALW